MYTESNFQKQYLLVPNQEYCYRRKRNLTELAESG